MVEPLELRVRADKRVLVVVWEGQRAELAAEYLRVESPSAEVKGHGVGQAKLVSGKREVLIQTLEPVGSYAVKIGFSDGHATGLYTWAYLRELADEQAARWACYLADLAAAGLSRDVVKPPVLRSALR
ncbi:MAG: DUF971 domain-containing protein [Proteobacteria bacterium]|nr:DUF971 domain-containing protein [Pseudomonadota bacterium]